MSKKITLSCNDGKSFEIDEAVALQSQTIAHLVKDNNNSSIFVPVTNVRSNILELVIEYCKKHVDGDSSSTDEDLKKWDTEFVKFDDESTVLHLINAAKNLDIESLNSLGCKRAAEIIANKSVEEVRAFFNIENDYTPEEEEEVRIENPLAFY
ncbi:SKP1-like protein 12 [Cardamine amara subsp. amara]|uniref:SKP1-like protein n=1 Tax=Cardamine amara subsp. amara TaxID=228776 RepID=A0ABD1AP42_CARAN